MEGTRVLLHLQSQYKQTTSAVASNWRAAYASNQRAPPRSHATRIPGLEQLTSAGDYLGWSRPSCQRRRKRRPESRTSLKNFRRRTLDAFGAREPNLLRDATALSCLVLAFCPCRLFYALINLPVFDPGRGESVVLLALPDVCVIFGINSVDFCNIGQFRVML